MQLHNNLLYTTSVLAIAIGMSIALPASAQQQSAPQQSAQAGGLETIVVTAQKREENLQIAPLAVTAVTGATLQKDRILSLEDLGHSVTGLSFTATSPQAQELNIRGVTNTRLTSPTADQSVSTFVDEVYVGRSGTLNTNFYDIERVEVIRGPQGVLLGKNVAGGAISVISAKPQFTNSGSVTGTIGDYGLHQGQGYLTGGLTDGLAGRLSFQVIDHSGYARDLAHNVDLEDLRSVQLRGQLRYEPSGSDFRANLLVEFSRDDSNGINRVPVTATGKAAGPDAWTKARNLIIAQYLPKLTIRQSFPTWPLFAGTAIPTPQDLYHRGWNGVLKLEKDVLPDVTLSSITGYRWGNANTWYDQSGIGPTNPYNVDAPLLFAEPVYFTEKIAQITEEARLTSNYGKDSRFDWILGAFYLKSRVSQYNRYWGETKYLPTLSGESNWDDKGKTESYAAFAKVGFRIIDDVKIDAGVRYTHDKKYGVQIGKAISRGSRFDPNDTAALTPLGLPPGTNIFNAPYSASWSKVTPQFTANYTPMEDLMAYATVSFGFKGGGFQNSATNAGGASAAYNPETVTNYEVGFKWETLNRTLRWNTAVFDEEYKNLQVQQTLGSCLCNVIGNAASATIRGFETELQYAPVHWFSASVSASYVDPKYNTFVDSTGAVYTGNTMQRTPKVMITAGAEFTTDFLSYPDALKLRLNYKHQGKMFWTPDNFNMEAGYGLLDGRVTFSPEDKPWAISIWGKNITAKDYRTSIIAILGTEISSFGAPRTFGADLSVKF